MSELEFWSLLGKNIHSILKFNCYITSPISKQIRFNYNRGNYEAVRKDLDIEWEEEMRGKKSVKGGVGFH